MKFGLSSAITLLSAIVLLLSPPAAGVCLPCQAAFRRPDAAQQAFRTRDVWAPHILNPSSQSVWFIDQPQEVTWNTTDMPARVSNPNCQVYLGEWDRKEKVYKKIYYDHPIASSCTLRDGNTTVWVPKESWVKPSNNWVVVLMGDSGDHSSPFTIELLPEKPQ
ncbi:hypothetical protein P691DRAFT_779599 [Macrolepiota fuliginosa MF-IS2]|uniref:Uncharacterized protein n=1 Tax=Macrolepiota fuliginosa MF-IS2 TaxID=1400762 RepID=A0A9P6BY01_9AGAR|nr:hypothetical protein P691DRAFT_779599 [Macrolepiota fuliginosa MF-IS2]